MTAEQISTNEKAGLVAADQSQVRDLSHRQTMISRQYYGTAPGTSKSRRHWLATGNQYTMGPGWMMVMM